MSDNVEALIAEARSDEPTDWRALAWHLADALEALDSAPPVARPLPDREALARVIDPAIYEDISHLTGSAWDAALRAADAVLAAIEKGGESA